MPRSCVVAFVFLSSTFVVSLTGRRRLSYTRYVPSSCATRGLPTALAQHVVVVARKQRLFGDTVYTHS